MEKEAAAMLRDYLESWVSVSDWKAVFIMTFLAVVFELLLLELCKTCHKKISERKVQKESCSDSSEEEENSFLKNLEYENWPHAELPPKRRLGALSRSQFLFSLDPQNTEDIINEMLATSCETWSGTSDNESQLSWPSGSGSRLSFSSEAISSSSFVNSVHRQPPPNHRRFSHLMFETLPFSSRKLLPMRKMCANKNKNVRFSSDHNFLQKSKITLENEDLDLTPCPSAHVYLPRNQIRLLEENLRNQIPAKSQPVIKIKTTYQSSNFAKLNQAPLYPSEETSCKREKMLQESLFHCPDDIRSNIFMHPQGLSQSEISVQNEVPGQAQDCNQIQNNINIQTSVKVRGLSKFQSAYYEKQEQFTTNLLDKSPPILSVTRDKTINPQILNIMENLNILNPKEELQKYSTVLSTCVPVSPQTKHKNGICPTDLKNTMGPRVMSLKAKKTSFSQLLNILGYGTLANRRKLECNIAKSHSTCAVKPCNVSPDSALKARQVSVPRSSFGHSRVRAKRDMLRATKIKSPLQVQNKKSPEKISYAQPLEKTPRPVENKGKFKESTDTSTLSLEYSDSKMQHGKNYGMIRSGLTVNNKENSYLSCANKIEFLSLQRDARQSKYVPQTVLNSVSFPKKFLFQPEKAKTINDATDPETFKISNSLGQKIPNKTDVPVYDCSRSGKKLKFFISRQKILQPKVVLKSFLCSIFAPVKSPLQSEKQKKSDHLGEDMERIIQDQSQGEETSLIEVKCEPLLDSERVANLQIVPAQEEISLIKAQLVECDGPRDSVMQGNYANHQEWFTTNQEGQQDQKCLPLTISKSGSIIKSCMLPLEQTSEEILEDSKKSTYPSSCEEIKKSLESHIKATDILQSICSTVPSPSQIKIKYVKIMEDKNNSVCIPLICEETKQSESKVETGVDSKCINAIMPSLYPNATQVQIVADITDISPSPEIKRSESCGVSEIVSNLVKSDTPTVEIVADVDNSTCCAPLCEEIKLHLETPLKAEDFSESNITTMPCPCSTAIVHPVEDIKETVASLVCEEIQKPPDDTSESSDVYFCSSPSVEPNSLSLNYEENVKRSLGSHKTKKSILESIFTSTPNQNSRKMKTVQAIADMSDLVCSSVGEEMQKCIETSIVLEPSDISFPLPLKDKKKSVQILEDVKKTVRPPICDKIIQASESHITEAVSNSIDASTHSPCHIKKKSVEVVLDLKKSLFSLPISAETKKSLESYIKTGGVMLSRGPFQKRISQLALVMKNSAFPPTVCGEMQSGLQTHIKIPFEKNWEIDRKTEKLPQKDTFLVKEGQEQIVADVTKEVEVSTHRGGRKKAFPKARDTVEAEYFKSQLCSISVLDRLTANEKTDLIFHFQKKRLELKQGSIHTIVIESYQKSPSLIKPCISKEAHSDRRVFPRCRKLNFMSQEEVDSLEMNLKHKYLMFLFGLPFNSQSSLKEIIPKAVTPIPSMIYQKHKAKYIEKNVLVIKRGVREKLESHIYEKQKLGFSNSIVSLLPQSFIPCPPENIFHPEEGNTVKRVIIEGETRKSLPCHLRKMAAEKKGGIASKLIKYENTTKELCPVSSMKAVIVNKLNVTDYVNENIKQAVEVNMQLRLSQKASYMAAGNKGGSLPLVFQRFTANDLKKLVTYFLVKSLEVKMNMIPKVVEESIKMVENQVQRKPRLESAYPTNKVTKPRSTKLPFMESKFLHQIILNLQHKCLMFLFRLPVETLPPELTISPKYLPRPKLNKKYNIVNEVGNQVSFSIDMEKLEQHISLKKQNSYKILSEIIKLPELVILPVSPSENIPMAMDDRTILKKTLSPNCSSIVLDSQCLTQKDSGEPSLRKPHWSLGEEKFPFKISPKLTKTVPDPLKDAQENTDISEDSKMSCLQKGEICPESQKSKHTSPTSPKKTNIDIVLNLHETSLQKTENAPNFFEIRGEHASSPEIYDIFQAKEEVNANTDSSSLKASYQNSEVSFQSQENVQRSVESNNSPPPPYERVEMEMSSQRSVKLNNSPPPPNKVVEREMSSQRSVELKNSSALPKKRVEREMSSQRSVELKNSSAPPKKRVEREMSSQKSEELKSPPSPDKRVEREISSQRSVALKNSSPPPKKSVEMEMEMPFQTPNVIFRTFKKSWENVPLSDGGPLRQGQKEMFFDIPFKLEDFNPLEKLSETNQVRTKTKPVYQKGDLIPQSIQPSGNQNSLITPPYYTADQHGKKKLHPKIHSPHWMSDSSLETQSMPYSLPREEKLSRKTWSQVSNPLASATDSRLKLGLETSDGKIILSLENKAGEKLNADLPKENTMKLDHSCNFTENEEKQKMQEEEYDSGLDASQSVLNHQQENDYFHFKRKNTQHFFYACTPADTPGNKSKTIRWNIPKNISGQSKFRTPLVAKFSNPEKIWSSSKKFLESVSAPFNLYPVHQK